MNKPLPWHDTPRCKEPGCGGPVVLSCEGHWAARCGACGTSFTPTPEEQAQISRAEAAWDLVLDGKAWESKACAVCEGLLLIDRERICFPCAEAENAKRQGSLFPSLTPP